MRYFITPIDGTLYECHRHSFNYVHSYLFIYFQIRRLCNTMWQYWLIMTASCLLICSSVCLSVILCALLGSEWKKLHWAEGIGRLAVNIVRNDDVIMLVRCAIVNRRKRESERAWLPSSETQKWRQVSLSDVTHSTQYLTWWRHTTQVSRQQLQHSKYIGRNETLQLSQRAVSLPYTHLVGYEYAPDVLRTILLNDVSPKMHSA